MQPKTRLFLLCHIAYTCSYLTRLDFSIAMSSFISDGVFTKTYGGVIATGFLACYGLGQLINGFLGDRVPPRLMIGIGLTGSAIANLLMAFVGSAFLLPVWCCNGFFCSMLWAPIIRCFAEFLPEDYRRKAGVRISTTIPLGTVLSYALGALVLRYLPYRMLFVCSGLIGLAAAAFWFFGNASLRDFCTPAVSSPILKTNTVSPKKTLNFPRLLLTTGLLFSVCVIFFNGTLKDAVTVWIPTYLKDSFAISESKASLISVVLPIVNLSGAYAAGSINHCTKNEMMTVVILFGVATGGILLLMAFGSFSPWLAIICLALCTSSMLGANTMLLTFIPLRFAKIGKSATISGFLDACSYLASAIASVSIGALASSAGWYAAMISWLAVALIGGIIAFFGRHTPRIPENANRN